MSAGLQCGKVSDLDSACSKMLVHGKIFKFQDMLNESERYCDATNGLHESTKMRRMKQTVI